MIKIWGKIRKVELLPARDCEAGYGPGYLRAFWENIVTLFFLLFIPVGLLSKSIFK